MLRMWGVTDNVSLLTGAPEWIFLTEVNIITTSLVTD